jgi:spore coat polysaccharide biosynthesis protein SpsF
MKVVAIVQARMGSSRLPGKILAEIDGRPMLRLLLDRITAVRSIEQVVVATTSCPEDDILERWCRSEKVACFRGSAEDVLDRFFHCADWLSADMIVRVTGDDPLKDPGIIGQAIQLMLDDPCADYCSNSAEPTYPEGVDIEVFRREALSRAHREAQLKSEREHVTPYIWKNPDKFRLLYFKCDRDLSHWRWTVDKPADLAFVREIYRQFRDRPLASFEEIVAFVDAHPHLLGINSGTARNEGYLKSLDKENG